MSNTYLMPAARNLNTGQVIKQQDLAGVRYTQADAGTVNELSQLLAASLGRRRRETWVAAPISYTSN